MLQYNFIVPFPLTQSVKISDSHQVPAALIQPKLSRIHSVGTGVLSEIDQSQQENSDITPYISSSSSSAT